MSKRRSVEVAAEAGITYRQLDYWTRNGWLHADVDRPGSGITRDWPLPEIAIARLMGRMTRAGLIPEVAAQAARALVEHNMFKFSLGEGLDLLDTSGRGW